MENNLPFIKGLELNEGFYSDIVKPLLAQHYPQLVYSAALIGYGSDVLGYDTEISMDHNWGPRLQIFVDDKKIIPVIDGLFKRELPFQYKNYPVNFSDPAYDGVQRMEYSEKRPVNHLIEIKTPEDYFKTRHSIDNLNCITTDDWLAFTDQTLLEITSGKVFYDGLNINKLRNELSFYPMDICKLRMAVLWNYIWNKEAFIGRSIAINDYIGLKINSTRIVNYLMKILFYLERTYIPYSKWFGIAFKKLTAYDRFNEIIINTLNETEPKIIERSLCVFYEKVIDEHNKNDQLPFIQNKIRDYFSRPYKVIFAENIVTELIDSIKDENIKKVDLKNYGQDIVLDL